jgi:hypothetical protein
MLARVELAAWTNWLMRKGRMLSCSISILQILTVNDYWDWRISIYNSTLIGIITSMNEPAFFVYRDSATMEKNG